MLEQPEQFNICVRRAVEDVVGRKVLR